MSITIAVLFLLLVASPLVGTQFDTGLSSTCEKVLPASVTCRQEGVARFYILGSLDDKKNQVVQEILAVLARHRGVIDRPITFRVFSEKNTGRLCVWLWMYLDKSKGFTDWYRPDKSPFFMLVIKAGETDSPADIAQATQIGMLTGESPFVAVARASKK